MAVPTPETSTNLNDSFWRVGFVVVHISGVVILIVLAYGIHRKISVLASPEKFAAEATQNTGFIPDQVRYVIHPNGYTIKIVHYSRLPGLFDAPLLFHHGEHSMLTSNINATRHTQLPSRQPSSLPSSATYNDRTDSFPYLNMGKWAPSSPSPSQYASNLDLRSMYSLDSQRRPLSEILVGV